MKRDPREEMTVKIERIKSSELRPFSKSARSFIEQSRIVKILLKILGVFGVSLIMSGNKSYVIDLLSRLTHARWSLNTGAICSRCNPRVR